MAGDFAEPGLLQVSYDSHVRGLLFGRLYRDWVDGLGLAGSETVLEFGPGSGNISRYLAGRLMEGKGRLICVDISQRWMKALRKRLAAFPNVDYLLGPLMRLPIDESSCDAIVVHFALHDVESSLRPSVVRTMARKLKPGGKLFVREPTRPRHGMPAEEIRALMRQCGLREIQALMSRPIVPGPVFSGIYRRETSVPG